MDADRFGSRSDRSEERYQAGSPLRESTEGAFDDSEEHDKDKSRELTKHRSKDKKKSRREDKDHRSRDRDHSKLKDDLKEKEKDFEKERIPIKEKRKEEKEEHEKDRTKDKSRVKDNDRDKHKGKDHDRDREEKDRGRKKDRERERDNDPDNNRGREKDRGKEKTKEKEEREKEKTKDKDRGKDKEREKDKERTRDRERDHEKNKDRDFLDREQAKDISREREREMDNEKERSRDKEKVGRRNREDLDHSKDGGRETKAKKDGDDNRERETSRLGNASRDEEAAGPPKQGDYVADSLVDPNQSRMEVAQRILRMKEERLKKTPEGTSEILSWVHKSRKLGEKRNSEKEKALRRSKIFEEQDNLDEDDNEVDNRVEENADSLAGVKVLHGIDKVLEGGSVVLTLKDQNILANGDLNEDVDMLENVEIGEQKRRGEAYKAAKKSSGIYVDKFNDEHGEEKKMLPQYDDPAEEEGVVLDAAGRFAGEAEKKLEELRRRLQGPVKNQAEDLNASARISSDYFTPEEMLQFRKPKKKKSLRKKDKLDLDALEAEARSTGLGATDLGSRNDSKRQAAKEEEERNEAERRKSAYQAAFSKADEASRALRMEQVVTPAEENDTLVFADDAEDLQKSLERTRKLALKKQNEKTLTGPEAVARLASVTTNNHATDAQNSTPGDASDNKVVFTEMEEFVWGLQLDEETQKPYDEDVFMEEDEMPPAFEEKKDETGGWTEVADSGNDEQPKSEDEEDVVPDKTLHEVPVGKGLSGVLKLLKDRGTLKETIEWGGRNMDKKKSKLVGIHEDDGPSQIRMDKKKGKLVDEVPREINLERLDEFGRVLTPKQAFRLLSHKFHGKGPGKMKQEKRMKQYHDELKQKQMTSSDMFPQSVEKMREAQAQLKTPYLVLSGHVKPGDQAMVSVSPCSSLLKLNPISISPPFFHNQPQSLTFNSFISSAKPLSFVSKPNRPANNNNYKNSIFSANSVAEQQENKQEEEFQVLTAARSEYNNIVILESTNSKILLLDDSGNIHSILYKDQNQKWTDSYWDEFCSLPAIIPNGPVAIFGLGGGTAAHQLLHFWQHLVVHGWELDEILIDRARMFFGLSDLEQISDDSSSSTNAGILRVHVGDALSPTANVEGGYAGIIVDLFADAKVLPQLEVAQTWLDMREKLMPNGRIMVNCGGASDSEKDGWEVNFTIKALCEAFGQEFVNWKKMPQNESGNYLAFTGPLPEMDMWSRSVPGKLSSAVNQWRPCKPLSS